MRARAISIATGPKDNRRGLRSTAVTPRPHRRGSVVAYDQRSSVGSLLAPTLDRLTRPVSHRTIRLAAIVQIFRTLPMGSPYSLSGSPDNAISIAILKRQAALKWYNQVCIAHVVARKGDKICKSALGTTNDLNTCCEFSSGEIVNEAGDNSRPRGVRTASNFGS
jgi:hypothetical protein